MHGGNFDLIFLHQMFLTNALIPCEKYKRKISFNLYLHYCGPVYRLYITILIQVGFHVISYSYSNSNRNISVYIFFVGDSYTDL